jgi:hypothetical protein
MKFSKKPIILLGKVLEIYVEVYILDKFYPLCEKYPNDYDLGKQIRKLSILKTKNICPNDGDLGSYARQIVNDSFKKTFIKVKK